MSRTIRVILITYVIVALFSSLCSAATTRHRASRGGFLAYRADTVNELVDEIQSNPKIAARFTKHFGVTKTELIDYFKNNLVLTTLDSSRKVTTYFIGRNERVLFKIRTLKAGDKVFMTRDGQLVIEWRCGNPLVSRLPAKPIVTKITPSVTEPEIKVAPAEPQELTVIPPPVSAVTTPVVAPVAPALTPVVEAAPAPPSILAPALIAAVPALVGAVRVHNDAPVVPEPASLAVLGFGISTAAFHLRRRIVKRK